MPRLMRDPSGRRIPLGRSLRQLPGNWLLGAHPTHIQVPSGTATFSGLGTGNGWCKVATDATANAIARVDTTFQLSLARHVEIALTLEGLTLDAESNVDVEFGFKSASAGPGVVFRQLAGEATGSFRTLNATPDTQTAGYSVLGPSADNSRNLTLLLQTGKRVYLLADDQEVKSWDMTATNYATGVVRPFVSITTKTATARSLYLLGFNLDFRDNRAAPYP